MASSKKTHLGGPIFVKLIFEGKGERLKPWERFLDDKALETQQIGATGQANMSIENLAQVMPEGHVREAFVKEFKYTMNIWVPCVRAKAPQASVANAA